MQQTISLLSIAALRTKTGSAPTSRQSRYCPSPRYAPRPAVHQPADNLVIVHRRVAHQDRQSSTHAAQTISLLSIATLRTKTGSAPRQQTISLLSIAALRTKTGRAPPMQRRQSRYCPSPRYAPRPAVHQPAADNLVIVHRRVAHQDRQSSNNAADNLVIVHRHVAHQDRQSSNHAADNLVIVHRRVTHQDRQCTNQQTISLLSIAALRTKTGSAPTSRQSRYCPSPRCAPRPAVHQPADNLVIVHRRVAHQDRPSSTHAAQTISLLSIATLRTKTGSAPRQQTISLLSIAALRTKTGRAPPMQRRQSRYCPSPRYAPRPAVHQPADNLVIVHRRVAHQDRQNSTHAAQTISLLSIATLSTKTGSAPRQQRISLLSIVALRTKTGRAPPMQRRQSRYCPSPRCAPSPAELQPCSRQSRYCPSPRCAPRPAELHPCSADNLVIVHRHVAHPARPAELQPCSRQSRYCPSPRYAPRPAVHQPADNLVIVHRRVTHQDRQCTNQQTISLLSIAALRTKTGRAPPMQRRQSRYCPSPRCAPRPAELQPCSRQSRYCPSPRYAPRPAVHQPAAQTISLLSIAALRTKTGSRVAHQDRQSCSRQTISLLSIAALRTKTGSAPTCSRQSRYCPSPRYAPRPAVHQPADNLVIVHRRVAHQDRQSSTHAAQTISLLSIATLRTKTGRAHTMQQQTISLLSIATLRTKTGRAPTMQQTISLLSIATLRTKTGRAPTMQQTISLLSITFSLLSIAALRTRQTGSAPTSRQSRYCPSPRYAPRPAVRQPADNLVYCPSPRYAPRPAVHQPAEQTISLLSIAALRTKTGRADHAAQTISLLSIAAAKTSLVIVHRRVTHQDRQCTNQQTISLLSIAALRTKTGSAPRPVIVHRRVAHHPVLRSAASNQHNLVIVHRRVAHNLVIVHRRRVAHQDRQCTNQQQTISLLSIAALRTKTGSAPTSRQSRYCPSPRYAPRHTKTVIVSRVAHQDRQTISLLSIAALRTKTGSAPTSRQSRYCPSPRYAPRPAVHQPADNLVIVHRRVAHQDRQCTTQPADNLVIVHRRVTHQDRQCTNQQTISLLSIAALRTKTGSAPPSSRQSRYCPSPRCAPRPAVPPTADNLVIVHRRVAHQDRQSSNHADNLVIVHRRVAHQDRQSSNHAAQTISLLSIATLRTKTGSAPTSRQQSRYCPSPRCAPRPAELHPCSADNLVIVHRHVTHQDGRAPPCSDNLNHRQTGSAPRQQTISLCPSPRCAPRPAELHHAAADNLVIVHRHVTHQDRQCTNQQTISLLSIAALRTKTGRAPRPACSSRQSRYCPSPRCAPRPAELHPCSADNLVIVHRRVAHQDRQSSTHAAQTISLLSIATLRTKTGRAPPMQQTISLLSIAALRTKTGSAPTSRLSRYCPSPRYAPRPAVHQPADNLVIVHRRVTHQDRQCTNQQTISLLSIAALRTKTGRAPPMQRRQSRYCPSPRYAPRPAVHQGSRQSRYCPSPRCAPRPAELHPCSADNLVIVHRHVTHQDRQCTNQQTISLLSIVALRTKTGRAPPMQRRQSRYCPSPRYAPRPAVHQGSRQSRYCPSPRCAPRPAEHHPCSADNLVIVHRHVAHQDRQSSNHAADNLVIVHRRVTHQDRQCTNQQTISLLSIATLRTKTGSAPTSRQSRYCPSPRYAPRPAVHQPADNLVIVHRHVTHQDRQCTNQQIISLLSIATLRTKTGSAPTSRQSRYCPSPRYAPRPAVHQPTDNLVIVHRRVAHQDRQCTNQQTISLLSITALRTKTGSAPTSRQSRYCPSPRYAPRPAVHQPADNLVIVHRRVAHQDRQCTNQQTISLLSIAALRTKTGSAPTSRQSRYCPSPRCSPRPAELHPCSADNLVIVHRRVTHQDRQCTNQQTISLLSIATLRTKTGSAPTSRQSRYCPSPRCAPRPAVNQPADNLVIVDRRVAHQDRQCTNQQTISLLSITSLLTKTGRAPPMQRRQSRYCPSPRYASRPAVHQPADNLVIVHRRVTHQDRQCTNQQTISLLSIAALRTKTGSAPTSRQSRYCPSPRYAP
ncbi:hypothetical protein QZH41_000266, partial [Actinostola sp. cb2023]